jgi:hypothetical protein
MYKIHHENLNTGSVWLSEQQSVHRESATVAMRDGCRMLVEHAGAVMEFADEDTCVLRNRRGERIRMHVVEVVR